MRVVLQIGFQKAHGRRREGQLIKAFINDIECSIGDKCGMYLTDRASWSKGMMWFMWEGELVDGDLIRIEAYTSIAGVGEDENRTFKSMYYTNEEAPVREIDVYGVGMRGYPLLKGKVLEIGSVSETDRRKSEAEEFLRKGFD